jgi:phenylacetate-CoA ligase
MGDPMVTRLQSSGTEGDRLVTLVHTFTLADRMANCLRLNERLHFLLAAERISTCRYAAPNCSDVECANPNSRMEDRLLEDGTLVLPVYHDLLVTPGFMLDRAFAEIREFRPNCLYVDPIHFSHLLDHAERHDLPHPDWSGAAVLTSYSLLTRTHRSQIERALGPGVPVVNVVAMSELGFVAAECTQRRLHLNTIDFFVELVDEACDEVPDGGVGELCITTVGDRLSPKIRYRTGDLYRRHPDRCACGSALPVADYLGRRRHSFLRPDGTLVTPADVDMVVGERPWLRNYQLARGSSGRFVFRCIGSLSPPTEELKEIQEALQRLLGADRVRVETTGYIPAERSGKFLTCKNDYFEGEGHL